MGRQNNLDVIDGCYHEITSHCGQGFEYDGRVQTADHAGLCTFGNNF